MLPAFARLWPRSLRSTREGRCQPLESSNWAEWRFITGHRNWKMLRRYTHLKPEQLRTRKNGMTA